ncbi:MAG: hypothetical protein IKN72_05465, partial [Clostridia bacterium]|nr:hypothetical protein [Clostridia bacterium]
RPIDSICFLFSRYQKIQIASLFPLSFCWFYYTIFAVFLKEFLEVPNSEFGIDVAGHTVITDRFAPRRGRVGDGVVAMMYAPDGSVTASDAPPIPRGGVGNVFSPPSMAAMLSN